MNKKTIQHQVLVIDDEVQWSYQMTKVINDSILVNVATDIKNAFYQIENNPEINIVFIDVLINAWRSKDNYFDVLIKRIKTTRPKMPIVAYTSAYFGIKQFSNFEKLGIDLFVSKHELFEKGKFNETIQQLLNKSQKKEITLADDTDIVGVMRNILNQEIEKYALIKEITLSIPEEGNFELMKPLIGFKRDIEKQIVKYDYSKNVFIMMKFREDNKDLSDFIMENLRNNGFLGVRADQPEWNITKNVYNPIAVLNCCKYGIALFDEPEEHQAYSPNVAYELGIMHIQNKNCLILKHDSLPAIPFDLIKDLYVNYKKDLNLKQIIKNWINQISLK